MVFHVPLPSTSSHRRSRFFIQRFNHLRQEFTMSPSDLPPPDTTLAQVEWGLPEDRAQIGEGIGRTVIDWFGGLTPQRAPDLDAPPVRGNFASEQKAVEAAAERMYSLTQDTGKEVGALVLEKDGQFSLGALQQGTASRETGEENRVQANTPLSAEELQRYRDQGYDVVSHVHTHPDSQVATADVGKEVTIPEGPSPQDVSTWMNLGMSEGYVVTGDGDVFETTLPTPEQLSQPDAGKHLRLDRIADVDPGYDNGLPANIWQLQGPDASGTMQAYPFLLPQQMEDRVGPEAQDK
jgi:hypothetical protein